ncbi:unnamed protein product [Spodoptera littoralis]|uniref:Uncharacterized protein n=1 Tax=Spodoptera littoralis TaxID=7109 RepID=A0A9P0I743_SPOLI|nr:unnamed protein product [Spodoptera littoralis]CAH1640054.1 unnamed protein product [Spodoptera littoralis]
MYNNTTSRCSPGCIQTGACFTETLKNISIQNILIYSLHIQKAVSNVMTYRQRADHARVAVGELVHYAGTLTRFLPQQRTRPRLLYKLRRAVPDNTERLHQ